MTSSTVSPGDLLLILTPLSYLEGGYQSAPSPQDLHAMMLEGMTPAQRRVLEAMDLDPNTLSSPSSLTSLDLKFWSSRGNADSTAPEIDSKRLMRIIRTMSCTDSQPDAASSQVRQVMPRGFIGLWAELPLITHSCIPNTSTTVVGDRILVHAVREISKGERLTRNLIGPSITAPLSVRQEAFIEQKLGGKSGLGCLCKRCQVEGRASESIRLTLEDTYSWFLNEAVPKWNEAQESESLSLLSELFEEANVMVGEVEEAVDQEDGFTLMDPGEIDDQDEGAREEEAERRKVWLRASAYDSYDMLVMADEFLNREKSQTSTIRACLELIRVFAPGSESHTSVSVKYEALTRARFELAEYLAAQELDKHQQKVGRRMRLPSEAKVSAAVSKAAEKAQHLQEVADEATELYLESFFARYGILSLRQLDALREGLEMFTEAIEQAAVMRSQGQTEMESNYEINGVNFKIIDRIGEEMGSHANEGGDIVDVEGQEIDEEPRQGMKRKSRS